MTIEQLDKVINILKDAKSSIVYINDPAVERTCYTCADKVIRLENLNDVQALDEVEIFISDSIDELNWLRNEINEDLR